MKNLGYFFLLAVCFLSIKTWAQEPVKHQIKSYTSENGTLYWNKKMPVYLRIATTPNEQGILLKNNTSETNNGAVYLDFEGKNSLKKKVNLPVENSKIPVEITWDVYADGIAPKTTSGFNEAQVYNSKTAVFYGVNLNVTLNATDQGAGVENIYYAINGTNYSAYNSQITFADEGKFTLSYYAADQVGNAEEPTVKHFIVDKTAPKTYYHLTGVSLDNIISTATILYLTPEDSSSGVAKTYYRFDNEEFGTYIGTKINVNQLRDGRHVLQYYSVDNVGNKETVQTYNFYLDKTAPILASDILGDRFIVDEQIYFSGRTKLKLTAVDNKAGIKHVKYSIDNSEFTNYEQPFYLPSRAGEHIIRYFADDRLDNRTTAAGAFQGKYEEFYHNVAKVYVDLTGPTMGYSISGENFNNRDTLFISSNSKIKLFGNDKESGFQYIAYSLNNSKEEIKFTQPFSLPTQGLNRIYLFAYDNVNNRNVSDFSIMVDNEPPVINYSYSITPVEQKDSLNVYPEYLIMYLSGTDTKVGTDKIYYTLNNEPEKVYGKQITGFSSGELNKLQIRAVDFLNNQTTLNLQFYIR
ncbi:MAG TPA: hypothetical protein DCQ31_12570 [Bacteroidales bacterium]|nr:hypothetical protein [Bacteroidales bacterium]